MNFNGVPDILGLSITLVSLSLIPLLVVCCSSFLKIALVLLVLRNAIGVQQVPPTLAIYGIALSLTAFVMAPTLQAMGQRAMAVTSPTAVSSAPVPQGLPGVSPVNLEKIRQVAEPAREFMLRFSGATQREAMLENARRLWPADMAKDATATDFLILMPAFVISELQAGYEIAFLIFLPFVVIDLLVSNILMALGMQQMSPQTVTIPLKLLLFVAVDGWSRLLQALALSYVG
jgi:type III secretion protein R